ncbi:MAG: tetratricopeptide repeat protein, partial [Planctomycetota bacterium]|nr:tetratricopeptide repeat protein [Planctomycetota bacterium]
EQCSRALEIYLDLYDDDDARTRLCRLTLGRALTWLGLKDQAEDQLTRALASARRQLGQEHPDTIFAMLELAQHYMDMHARAGEAETLCREVLESPGAATRAGTWTELHARAQLAFALSVQFQNHEAMRLALQTREDLRARKAEGSGLYLFVHFVLGLCATNLGDFVGAEAYYRAGSALAVELAGDESFIAATSHQNIAHTLISQHRWAEAEPEARTAYETHLRNMGERHPYTRSTRVMLIASQFAQRADDAVLQRQAQAIIEASVESHSAEPLRTTNALAGFFLESGDLDQAGNVLAWGLTLKQQTLEYPRPEPYEHMMLQARLDTARGRFEQAAELFRSTLAQAAARLPEWTCHPASMLDYGTCELRLGNHAASEELLLECYDRFTDLKMPRDAAITATRLVELYEAMQRPEDADIWRARLGNTTSTP